MFDIKYKAIQKIFFYQRRVLCLAFSRSHIVIQKNLFYCISFIRILHSFVSVSLSRNSVEIVKLLNEWDVNNTFTGAGATQQALVTYFTLFIVICPDCGDNTTIVFRCEKKFRQSNLPLLINHSM